VLIECVVAETRIMLNFAIDPVAVAAIEWPAAVVAGAAVICGRTAGLLSGANR
jgi:hypothetical protein